MPNNCRPDQYPEDVHSLPPALSLHRKRETELLGGLWEDFGDPDFPVSTAAVFRFYPERRSGR